MSRIRTMSACFVATLALAPLPAQAQGTNSAAARIAALEARVARLEGNITAADLAGTYRAAGLVTDLDGGNPASVQIIAFQATVTLAANGTGTISQAGSASGFIALVQGTPWTDSAVFLPNEDLQITWTYANGILHVSHGTVNLDLDFFVGAGGRMLTWAGLSDDNTADIVIGTRLQ